MSKFLENYHYQMTMVSGWGALIGSSIGIIFTNIVLMHQSFALWTTIMQIVIIGSINYFVCLPLLYMAIKSIVDKMI